MNDMKPASAVSPPDVALRVYLLGTIDFEDALRLQRRLVFDISGDRSQGALVLCQHNPVLTVGRQGSFAHIHCEPEELSAREWRVRWVNRGGGCLLHVPGQLAIYPILPLDRLGLGLRAYTVALQDVILATLGDFLIRAHTRSNGAGIWVGPRPLATFGIAVRDWVSYYGAYFNINPSLDLFRFVQSCGSDQPMSSLERERRAPLSPALVRQRLIEHFTERFGFERFSLFTDHPLLKNVPQKQHAVASRS